MIVVQEGYEGTVVTPQVSLDMVRGIRKGEGVALQAGETRVLSRAQLLEWCRDNSIVWENPVRENTTHYTVEYTCKTVLVVSYHALGCERTCISGSKSLTFIRKGLFILVCV